MIENVEFDLSDYLVAEIAVVDQSGAIVHCNRKWEETAKTGMLFPKLAGWNYIEECEAAIRRGSIDAVGILAGLRAVLAGRTPVLRFELFLSVQWSASLVSDPDLGLRSQRRTACHADAR